MMLSCGGRGCGWGRNGDGGCDDLDEDDDEDDGVGSEGSLEALLFSLLNEYLEDEAIILIQSKETWLEFSKYK